MPPEEIKHPFLPKDKIRNSEAKNRKTGNKIKSSTLNKNVFSFILSWKLILRNFIAYLVLLNSRGK
jgi:hypothetical protein